MSTTASVLTRFCDSRGMAPEGYQLSEVRVRGGASRRMLRHPRRKPPLSVRNCYLLLLPVPRISCLNAMPVDYLQKILTAKVYDVAVESPLDAAPVLSQRLGNRVLLKREDQQPVFSFKLRGAYNKMAHLTPAVRERGVIAASAGNHAQGVALAAQRLGCKATIVMPLTTPHIKIAAVEARGGA